MLNPDQFVRLILEPCLKATGTYSLNAMYLMMCTAIVESKLTHLQQLPNGKALGLFQIEWATYLDCARYLNQVNIPLRTKILLFTERVNLPVDTHSLIADLNLNTLIARTKYWMIPEQIPSFRDAEGQAAYHEKYYNANPSNDMTKEFIQANKYCGAYIHVEEI